MEKITSFVQENIKAFAKENKIGALKLEKFVENTIQTVIETIQNAPKERKVSEKSQKIRGTITQFREEGKESFTSADVARVTGYTLNDVNNNLFSLHRKQVIYEQGKQKTGGRGKPATVWGFSPVSE